MMFDLSCRRHLGFDHLKRKYQKIVRYKDGVVQEVLVHQYNRSGILDWTYWTTLDRTTFGYKVFANDIREGKRMVMKYLLLSR